MKKVQGIKKMNVNFFISSFTDLRDTEHRSGRHHAEQGLIRAPLLRDRRQASLARIPDNHERIYLLPSGHNLPDALGSLHHPKLPEIRCPGVSGHRLLQLCGVLQNLW